MTAQSDRRWAELARELEFGQLQELRKQAEGWRTGLTALTGLLAALAVLKGRENLADLPPTARYIAMGCTAAAFVLFLAGSVFAVRASHGRPGAEILLGGQALRAWTDEETTRITRSLKVASVCCLAGIGLVTGGVAVAWLNTSQPSTNLVKVTTDSTTSCGELVTASATEISLWTKERDVRVLSTIPLGPLSTVTPTRVC